MLFPFPRVLRWIFVLLCREIGGSGICFVDGVTRKYVAFAFYFLAVYAFTLLLSLFTSDRAQRNNKHEHNRLARLAFLFSCAFFSLFILGAYYRLTLRTYLSLLQISASEHKRGNFDAIDFLGLFLVAFVQLIHFNGAALLLRWFRSRAGSDWQIGVERFLFFGDRGVLIQFSSSSREQW